MADETNTSDTQNSGETTGQNLASTDQSSSTTQTSQPADDTASGAGDAAPTGDGTTLLTGGDGDNGAEGEGAGDGQGDKGSEDGETANELLGAPEGDYEIDLGEGVTVDKDAIGFIAPLAKEIGLSNVGMNKLAGVYAEQVLPHVTEQVTNQIVENIKADHLAQMRDWEAETRLAVQGGKDKDGNAVAPDPDFGGKQLGDVIATAAKAVRRFGGNEFADYLEKTGLGNDPRMVKAMFRAGAAISEDSTFERGATSRTKTDAEVFYPAGTT